MSFDTLGAQNIPAASSVTATLTVRSCTLGDLVLVAPRTPDANFANVVWHAFVSAPDTITIKLTNVGTTPAATPRQAFDLKILKNS